VDVRAFDGGDDRRRGARPRRLGQDDAALTPSAAATRAATARDSSVAAAESSRASAMRRPAVPKPSSGTQGSAGRSAQTGSLASGPWSASKAIARSATERANGPT